MRLPHSESQLRRVALFLGAYSVVEALVATLIGLPATAIAPSDSESMFWFVFLWVVGFLPLAAVGATTQLVAKDVASARVAFLFNLVAVVAAPAIAALIRPDRANWLTAYIVGLALLFCFAAVLMQRRVI